MITYFNVYVFISLIMAGFCLFLGIVSIHKKNRLGKSLGGVCVGAFAMTMFYVACIFAPSKLTFSIISSLYFYSVDVLVIFVYAFSVHFTEGNMATKTKIKIHVVHFLCLVDFILLVTNIFTNIAVDFIATPGTAFGYKYDMHAPFYFHLVFDYVVLIVAFYMIIRKMIVLPWEYKKPFFVLLAGIVVVVLVNAIWLYFPKRNPYRDLDYSVLGFGIAAAMLYWATFIYKSYHLPSIFRNQIVESVDQGIVLFDLDGNIILNNKKAEQMLPNNVLRKNITLSEFTAACDIDLSKYSNMSLFTTQVVVDSKPIKCDCHILENKKHLILGQLFVFSETKSGIDLMTGFHTLESFEYIAGDMKEMFSGDITVVLMDMIGLKVINYNEGRLAGDEKIRQLATAMKEVFPKDTFFVRGQDANLLAICRNIPEDKAREFAQRVQEIYDGNTQFSISSKRKDKDSISLIISHAERALRSRKLMDRQSKQSEVLNSMLVALQECDNDTEKHVERTSQMGAELGKKIGLSEVELSDLSLLCILHDIGKIGIPLEILNKPAKLTDEEWKIMRSHVEKGYQITQSNQEFAAIADMVRYHHERWDGKGYPDGLKEKEIPKLSRIISIVDAYDAMVNDRIYRPAMDPKDAQAEILKCAGSQFDPYIAEQFVEMLQESKFKQISDEISAKVTRRKEEKEKRKKVLQDKLASSEQLDNMIEVRDYARMIMRYDGLITEANDNFKNITGYTDEDIATNNLYLSHLVFDENLKEYVEKVSGKVRKGEAVYFKFKLRCKDGSGVEAVSIAKLFYDSTKKLELGEFMILESNK